MTATLGYFMLFLALPQIFVIWPISKVEKNGGGEGEWRHFRTSPKDVHMPLTTIKEQHSKKVLFDNWPTFLPLLVKVPLCNFHFNIYTLNKISCN